MNNFCSGPTMDCWQKLLCTCSADIKGWALLEFWSIRKQKLWPKQVLAKFIKKWPAGIKIKITIQALSYIFAKQSARAWTFLKLWLKIENKQASVRKTLIRNIVQKSLILNTSWLLNRKNKSFSIKICFHFYN